MTCADCRGRGKRLHGPPKDPPGQYPAGPSRCRTCDGTGKIVCPTCKGQGRYREGFVGGQTVGMEPTGRIHVCSTCEGEG